jgi:hypothetical protein
MNRPTATSPRQPVRETAAPAKSERQTGSTRRARKTRRGAAGTPGRITLAHVGNCGSATAFVPDGWSSSNPVANPARGESVACTRGCRTKGLAWAGVPQVARDEVENGTPSPNRPLRGLRLPPRAPEGRLCDSLTRERHAAALCYSRCSRSLARASAAAAAAEARRVDAVLETPRPSFGRAPSNASYAGTARGTLACAHAR